MQSQKIFNKTVKLMQRNRAAQFGSTFDYLKDEIAARTVDRL